MSLETNLVALFQAPFDDAAVTNSRLVVGYTTVFHDIAAYALQVDAINPTTQDLADRQATGEMFVVSSLCACFAAMAEGMAGKAQASEYKSADEVEADLGTLLAAWDLLAERSVDADVRALLTDLYTRIAAKLTAVEVTLPRVSTMDVPAVPASVLAYWLYDTDERGDTLVNLNPTLPPFLYDGDASVLTE